MYPFLNWLTEWYADMSLISTWEKSGNPMKKNRTRCTLLQSQIKKREKGHKYTMNKKAQKKCKTYLNGRTGFTTRCETRPSECARPVSAIRWHAFLSFTQLLAPGGWVNIQTVSLFKFLWDAACRAWVVWRRECVSECMRKWVHGCASAWVCECVRKLETS